MGLCFNFLFDFKGHLFSTLFLSLWTQLRAFFLHFPPFLSFPTFYPFLSALAPHGYSDRLSVFPGTKFPHDGTVGDVFPPIPYCSVLRCRQCVPPPLSVSHPKHCVPLDSFGDAFVSCQSIFSTPPWSAFLPQ